MTSNVFFSAQTLKKISNFCDTQLYGIPSMVAPPQIIQEFHQKTPYFNGKKVANGLSGCTDNPHRLDPIKKKTDPITRFVPNFSNEPRCTPIKSYRGRSLGASERRSAERVSVVGAPITFYRVANNFMQNGLSGWLF